MAQFCPNCGAKAEEGTRFCGKCGTNLGDPLPVAPALPPAAPSAPPPPPPTRVATAVAPPPPSPSPQAKSGSGKVVVIVLIVVGLLIVVGVGGAAYLAYRAKKKFDQVKEAVNSGDPNAVANAIGGGTAGKTVEAMPAYPEYNAGPNTILPADLGAPSTGAIAAGGNGLLEIAMGHVLPMRKGLRIITAIQESIGDYESIKEIRSVNEEGVLMDYSADNIPQPENPFMSEQEKERAKKTKRSVHTSRKILSADLQNSHEYAETFSTAAPLTLPNTTALGLSSVTYNDLMTKGEAEFSYHDVGIKGALGGLLGGIAGMTEQMNKNNPNAPSAEDQKAQQAMKDLQSMGKVNCTMKRTDQKVYAFPVLLNDERVQLPAIRANCKSDDGNLAEFYILNDAQNPLSLTWKIGKSNRLQVVKIEYVAAPATQASGASGGALAESPAAKQLEQKLAQQEKVRIYGIYFDFASAEIKPQSKPTLDEIAAVMNAHPDWKLNVGGHTDNIGGDAFNMQLSQQRADAVKQALVTQYKISAERLATAGYGASSPVETNDTMEGRARNRRVELSKQ